MPTDHSPNRTLLPNRQWMDENSHLFQYVYGQIPKATFKSIARYWQKRYVLFSRYDEGIYMTDELWYSVTPEAMAIFIAKFIKACDPEIKTILDVFSGGGGNLIQFARFFGQAHGVEFNERHVYCSERNCEVYGVLDRVEHKLGSWVDLIGSKYYEGLKGKIDFIFSSPPWGGPAFKNHAVYDLEEHLEPMGLRELLESFFAITPNVALFLPKNSNWDQLSEVTRDLLGDDAKCRVIFVSDQYRCKGILAFWGDKFQAQGYDYTQELDEMKSYYMTEKAKAQFDDTKTTAGHDTYEHIADNDRWNRDDRYVKGDYSADFYDEPDEEPVQEQGGVQQGPSAWWDPNTQLWYSVDATTGESYYLTEQDVVLPEQGQTGDQQMELDYGESDQGDMDVDVVDDQATKDTGDTGPSEGSEMEQSDEAMYESAVEEIQEDGDDKSEHSDNSDSESELDEEEEEDEDDDEDEEEDDDGPPEESSSKLL